MNKNVFFPSLLFSLIHVCLFLWRHKVDQQKVVILWRWRRSAWLHHFRQQLRSGPFWRHTSSNCEILQHVRSRNCKCKRVSGHVFGPLVLFGVGIATANQFAHQMIVLSQLQHSTAVCRIRIGGHLFLFQKQIFFFFLSSSALVLVLLLLFHRPAPVSLEDKNTLKKSEQEKQIKKEKQKMNKTNKQNKSPNKRNWTFSCHD